MHNKGTAQQGHRTQVRTTPTLHVPSPTADNPTPDFTPTPLPTDPRPVTREHSRQAQQVWCPFQPCSRHWCFVTGKKKGMHGGQVSIVTQNARVPIPAHSLLNGAPRRCSTKNSALLS